MRNLKNRFIINLFLTESETLKVQLKEVKDREDMVSGHLGEVTQQSEQIKATYARLDEHLARLDQEMEESRGKKNQAELLKGNLEGRINVLLEQIHTEKINAEHMDSRIRAIEKEAEEKESQIKQYQKENQELSVQAGESLKTQEQAEEMKKK